MEETMMQDPFGLDAKPPALSIKLVDPDRRTLIVVSRVEDDPEPDYHVVGRTRCMRCDQWCHLGHETIKVVESGEATPFCLQCATPMFQNPGRLRFIGHADDSAAGC